MRGDGKTSDKDIYGYHGAFQGANGSLVRYAVLAYPGGSIPINGGPPVSNLFYSWIFSTSDAMTRAFGNMTQDASHEVAEAVTNPDSGYSTTVLGWYDDARGTTEGEVGDLTDRRTVYLDGYAVQRIADQHGQAMTPTGATSLERDNFYLTTDGSLWMTNSFGGAFIYSGVASVSDQSIDNRGFAVVDYVTVDGRAFEYHSDGSSFLLGSNIRQAKAGQGVSYLLSASGVASEYSDTTGTSVALDTYVQSIDAGTDQYGVSMMTDVRKISYYRNGVFITLLNGYELSDSTGRHFIAGNVGSMSAGQQGFMTYVTTSGDAYWYSEATAFSSYLGSGVASVTLGTDRFGNDMIDLLFATGSLWEWRQGTGWNWLSNGVASIGKAHADELDVVFTSGVAYIHDSYGWYYVASNVKAAA